jgi:putative ABC transport system ATP-binding protein
MRFTRLFTKTKAATALPDEATVLIRMLDVVKIYPNESNPVKALNGINLEVRRGEFLAITGRSGSGKTTLLNLLSGLDRPTSGEIWVNNKPVHRFSEDLAAGWRGENIGIIFQSFHLIPSLTILQNVTLPMDFSGWGTLRQRQERGMALLAQLDIEQHAHKRPSQISGGQQQRVAIARSLSNNSSLLVADEPTGSLDSHTAQGVISIFKSLSKQQKTVVMVTHDAELARTADRIISLSDGEIV